MKIYLSFFSWAQKCFPMIVHMTHCSQKAVNALADILLQKQLT